MAPQILNYTQITPHLSCAGKPTYAQLERLGKEGFEVVINLAVAHTTLKYEDRVLARQKISYFHLPVTWEAPEVAQLELFLEIMSVLYGKKRVLVHCVMNYRASVFIYRFMRDVLKKDVPFIAPKTFVPDANWNALIHR